MLTITRVSPEKPKIKVKAKQKSAPLPTNISIYKFNSFDNYSELCNLILNDKNAKYAFFKKSSLYYYKSNYYLCIYIDYKDLNNFKPIHYSIIEYSELIKDATLFERKLKEYGKIIFKSNAINNCVKHFQQ